MAEGDTETGKPATPPESERESLRESFARLISSGREMADAELTWARLKAQVVAAALARAALLCLLALVFLGVGLALFVVASVVALAPLVGWVGATLIVAGTCVLLAALLGFAARHIVYALFRTER